MIAPIGELLSPPTHPVRRPSRASAYATLYSPPPTHTSSSGANSMRPCCGGERRTMHSPRLTRSKRQSLASRIFISAHPFEPNNVAMLRRDSSDDQRTLQRGQLIRFDDALRRVAEDSLIRLL